MTICYFGIYKPDYIRNKTLMMGLRQNGVDVIECNTRETSNKKYWRLIKSYWPMRKKCDAIIVGFPGHTMMPLAWLLARISGKKVIFDAFLSLYEANIYDRQKHSPRSLTALKYWIIDWLACVLADVILLDADEHHKYFAKTFHTRKSRMKTILVGCDDTVIYPREQKKNTDNFLVHFHGSYVAAQGIPHIIRAAKILENEDMEFNVIGRLETYGQAILLAKGLNVRNVNFLDYMPYEKLAEHMAMADVCLGRFGDNEKARHVGACKVSEALAMKKPLITADTPSMREFLTDGKDVLFCKAADSEAIAEKIRVLKNDPELRKSIAENGYAVFVKKLAPKIIGSELKKIISALL